MYKRDPRNTNLLDVLWWQPLWSQKLQNGSKIGAISIDEIAPLCVGAGFAFSTEELC